MEEILSLDEIETDSGFNPRKEALDQEVVTDYAAHIDDLPAMHVFVLDGCYRLVAGFHRIAAHRQAGRLVGRFIVHEGTWEEAAEFADLDNLKHGKSLTRQEKRAIIKRMIGRHPEWSNSRLAQICLTSDKTVAGCREELEAEGQIKQLQRLLGADGVERPRFDTSDVRQKRRHTKLVERLTPCECCRHPLSTRAHLLDVATWGENEFSVQLCQNCHELYDIIAVVFEKVGNSSAHSIKLLSVVMEIWGPKHPVLLYLSDLAQRVQGIKQGLNSANPAVMQVVANGGAKWTN
jgi:hypothetical protein